MGLTQRLLLALPLGRKLIASRAKTLMLVANLLLSRLAACSSETSNLSFSVRIIY